MLFIISLSHFNSSLIIVDFVGGVLRVYPHVMPRLQLGCGSLRTHETVLANAKSSLNSANCEPVCTMFTDYSMYTKYCNDLH